MTETYCLKSCTECGREDCAGCRRGAFGGQCEIIKCCQEKHHESCGSCTSSGYCGIRGNRDLMPEKVFALQRREAELIQKQRTDALILAKWTRMIFWCLIANFVVSFVEMIPAMRPVFDVFNLGMLSAIAYGFYRLKETDSHFHTIAGLQLGVLALSLLGKIVQEESAISQILSIINAVLGVILMKTKSETFRDTLCGISREMSGKWANQWKLYRIGLCIMLGCVAAVLIPVLGPLALFAILAGAGLVIFVSFREYVYLYQTSSVCTEFSGHQNYG